MNLVDPLAPLRAALFCAIAFVVGLVVGGVPSYFIGSSHGEAKHLVAVGALKTSVDSCTTAAQEGNKAIKAEAVEGKAREERVNQAIADGVRLAAEASRARSKTLQTPIRGDTECEQLKNAVDDHFRRKP